jgi:hypothetical protein
LGALIINNCCVLDLRKTFAIPDPSIVNLSNADKEGTGITIRESGSRYEMARQFNTAVRRPIAALETGERSERHFSTPPCRKTTIIVPE